MIVNVDIYLHKWMVLAKTLNNNITKQGARFQSVTAILVYQTQPKYCVITH